MHRRTHRNLKSKRFRVKSRRGRRGGAPPSAEEVRDALIALETLNGLCDPKTIETIKKGIYMNALSPAAMPVVREPAVSASSVAPPLVSRPTHEVDPREYEAPGSFSSSRSDYYGQFV